MPASADDERGVWLGVLVFVMEGDRVCTLHQSALKTDCPVVTVRNSSGKSDGQEGWVRKQRANQLCKGGSNGVVRWRGLCMFRDRFDRPATAGGARP